MCAGTGAHLHLVEPLGFELTEKHLRRAGLDYHDLADVTVHATFDEAMAAVPGRVFAFTTTANTRFTDIAFEPGDALLLELNQQDSLKNMLSIPESPVSFGSPCFPVGVP